jgi:2-polyprenyl-3-methyl-5-hydroxy-6-metoxy-1,4-benzoquinol methylase
VEAYSATVSEPSGLVLGGKPASYYEQGRPELVALLPWQLGRVLDVGCGRGGVGRALRPRAESLVGIELDHEAAAQAREVYDRVLVGPVETVLGEAGGPFDTILLYDVIEHLVDPAGLLRSLLGLAAPGGVVHVSVPNARHFSLVRDLVWRGTFGYAEWGHRDNTHLRWFTRRDLVALLAAAGWRVERTAHAPLSAGGRLAERITRGLSAEFLVHQWSALARAPGGQLEGGAA